jgi:predicted heme/steroid binding protein/uncharacterized membrane protein
MKTFTKDVLAEFDGKEGRPAYIAQGGKVFDVSKSKLWPGGLHMKRHHAGQDLSTALAAAPHDAGVLERYPQVGVLEKAAEAERPVPQVLALLLSRYPALRRHPHPIMVHFPIAFLLAAVFFDLLYRVVGGSFATTALHCLAAGVLFTPLGMLTGFYAWWLNYQARPIRATTLKIRFSFLLLGISIGLLFWRAADPGILNTLQVESVLFVLLELSLVPLVTAIGWLGAGLTLPVEKI